MKQHLVWSVFLILFATGIGSAQAVTYLPQIVDGTLPGGVGWLSVIAATNAGGTGVASGSITLTADNGSPLNLSFLDDDGQPTANTFQLAAGQTKFFLTPSANSPQPFNSGYATITSNAPVSAVSLFIEVGANNGSAIGTAGTPASTPLLRQAIFVIKDEESNTGLAVANPGTGAAIITFQLLDKSGAQIVPPVTRTVAANAHTALFVSELFPNAPTTITGTLRISSDKAIVTTGLFFHDATFGTLPVIPLP